MEVIKLRVTSQSLKLFYSDGNIQTMRYDKRQKELFIKKYKLVLDKKESSNYGEVYSVKADEKTEVIKDEVIKDEVIENEVVKTDFDPFTALEGLKLTKAVYKRVKVLNSEQCELLKTHMAENRLNRINDNLLDELGI